MRPGVVNAGPGERIIAPDRNIARVQDLLYVAKHLTTIDDCWRRRDHSEGMA